MHLHLEAVTLHTHTHTAVLWGHTHTHTHTLGSVVGQTHTLGVAVGTDMCAHTHGTAVGTGTRPWLFNAGCAKWSDKETAEVSNPTWEQLGEGRCLRRLFRKGKDHFNQLYWELINMQEYTAVSATDRTTCTNHHSAVATHNHHAPFPPFLFLLRTPRLPPPTAQELLAPLRFGRQNHAPCPPGLLASSESYCDPGKTISCFPLPRAMPLPR